MFCWGKQHVRPLITQRSSGLIQLIWLSRQVSPSSLTASSMCPSWSCTLSQRWQAVPIQEYLEENIPWQRGTSLWLRVYEDCVPLLEPPKKLSLSGQLASKMSPDKSGLLMVMSGCSPLPYCMRVALCDKHNWEEAMMCSWGQIKKDTVASALFSPELLALGETNCHVVRTFRPSLEGPAWRRTEVLWPKSHEQPPWKQIL